MVMRGEFIHDLQAIPENDKFLLCRFLERSAQEEWAKPAFQNTNGHLMIIVVSQ